MQDTTRATNALNQQKSECDDNNTAVITTHTHSLIKRKVINKRVVHGSDNGPRHMGPRETARYLSAQADHKKNHPSRSERARRNSYSSGQDGHPSTGGDASVGSSSRSWVSQRVQRQPQSRPQQQTSRNSRKLHSDRTGPGDQVHHTTTTSVAAVAAAERNAVSAEMSIASIAGSDKHRAVNRARSRQSLRAQLSHTSSSGSSSIRLGPGEEENHRHNAAAADQQQFPMFDHSAFQSDGYNN